MTVRVVVIGAGGMGRCALDVIDAMNEQTRGTIEVVGVLDDGDPDVALLSARGVSHLGGLDHLRALPSTVGYVIGIADPETRRSMGAALIDSGRPSPVIVHPNVHSGHDVQLGPGSIVCSHVSIENHVRLGRHVHVNQNSTVGHDTVIEDYCTISPLAAISGGVTMARSVFIGTGASVNQGVTLGGAAVVGAGAAVIRDVASGSTVVGVPARPLDGKS